MIYNNYYTWNKNNNDTKYREKITKYRLKKSIRLGARCLSSSASNISECPTAPS